MPFIFSKKGHELILFSDETEMISYFDSVCRSYFEDDKVVFEDGTAGQIVHPAEGKRYWTNLEKEDLRYIITQLNDSLTRTDMELDKVDSWQELFSELSRLEEQDQRTGRCIAFGIWIVFAIIITIIIKLIL